MSTSNAVRSAIYLHGFASSPASSKATRFGRELESRGIAYHCPDLNAPEFETLTTTRMLAQTRAVVEQCAPPVALIGSSLGGFVAVHAAAEDDSGRIDRLILMAPAFDFGGNRLRQLGDHGIDHWRRTGRLEFFHYAFNEPRHVGFELYEDAARYDAFAVELSLPILIFQGTRDASVDPEMVTRWAASRPNVTLRLLDDDHQLTQSIETIWEESEGFLT
jgi:alpha-beta hydrolase superfamily lysophospholipase